MARREAAREVAQETMPAVLPVVREARVREPDQLPAFVLGTCRNLVNSYRRGSLRASNPGSLAEADVAR